CRDRAARIDGKAGEVEASELRPVELDVEAIDAEREARDADELGLRCAQLRPLPAEVERSERELDPLLPSALLDLRLDERGQREPEQKASEGNERHHPGSQDQEDTGSFHARKPRGRRVTTGYATRSPSRSPDAELPHAGRCQEAR